MLEPVQIGEWLGFVRDTIKMEFRDPLRKILKLKGSLDIMLSTGSTSFGELARVAGFLNSLHLAVGPIARFLRYPADTSSYRGSVRQGGFPSYC